jgi:glycosyltransferase involved in cell wall biosynthesis
MMEGTILAIPFYGQEQLLSGFIDYFQKYPSEREIFKHVLIIGDDPDGDNQFLQCKSFENNYQFIKNEVNKGFVKSSNIAFDLAREEQCNLLLLNSDVRPYAGCFKEMLEVMRSDDRISTVCPRTNNGSIANFYPWSVDVCNPEVEEKLTQDFERVKSNLPRITFSPISVGFCILIRAICIEEFGTFDQVYGFGYEEENDLCMRYSQYGYRSAIANHALAFHVHGLSFIEGHGTQSREGMKAKNYQQLVSRYPYYPSKISEYLNSVNYRSFYNVTGATWDNAILVDITGIGLTFNGTSEIAIKYIKKLLSSGVYLDICSTPEEYKFHGLDECPNNKNFSSPTRYYKVGLKIGQPFDVEALITVPKFCYKSVLLFQDSIAYDCQYLTSEKLEVMWQEINSLYSNIVFISEYSRSIYQRRFGCPLDSKVILHSTNVSDYLMPINQNQKKKDYIFVLANNFKHKGFESTFNILKNIKFNFRALGTSEKKSSNIHIIESGRISEEELGGLYENSIAVLYPSYYEGFGLPIMNALAHNKVVLCRNSPPFMEIYDQLPDNLKKLIIFYDRSSDLAALINSIVSSRHDSGELNFGNYLGNCWRDRVDQLIEYINQDQSIAYSFIYKKFLDIKLIELTLSHSILLEKNIKYLKKSKDFVKRVGRKIKAKFSLFKYLRGSNLYFH